MSYIKDDSAVDTIKFYETTESLFNEIKQRTAYRSKDLVGGDGTPQFDKFAIMDDDEPFFDTLMNYAVPVVFSQLARIANGVTDSVFVDEEITALIGDGSGFSLVDHDAYDDNILTVIDKRIRECYVQYVLKEVWSVRGLEEERKKAEMAYKEALYEMKDAAWSLIKPLMS
jgi:hypothetical protein